MLRNKYGRRTFVKATAGVFAMGAASPLIRAASPNSKLNHAVIGVGGMGGVDRQNFAGHEHVRIAALCDVDRSRLDGAGNDHPEATKYDDWRELIEAEGDKIDMANASVPDHMHFPIAMALIRKGKHVYCQKPMCHDVAEVRALTQAAADAGVHTQLGTQAASTTGSRMAEHYIREGVIGKIQRVVLCSNRPGAIEAYRLEGPRPATADPIPENLNWDLWLGTAPERHFNNGIYHSMKWRAWQDFGTGWSGDIGCHLMHAPWVSLGLRAPSKVTARVQESWQRSPDRRRDTWPQSDHIVWTFPGNELTDGDIEMDWYDGHFYPPEEVLAMAPSENYPPESALWLGTEGALLLPNGGAPMLLPREQFREQPRPELPAGHHYHDFVDAIRAGETSRSDFSISGPMSETVLLGTVAIRVPDVDLTWDATALRFPYNPEADHYLRRSYRAGWEVPGFASA
ncbi:MAG: Gfo/Idh/MocA family oxidoreductase [Phycisphaeraceae bacterium]